VETGDAAGGAREAIELLQRNSGWTAVMDFEPIHRARRDARVSALHGALNLEPLIAEFKGKSHAHKQVVSLLPTPD
jgi:hypothetical protein